MTTKIIHALTIRELVLGLTTKVVMIPLQINFHRLYL